MNSLRLLLAGLRHHGRIHAAVALGVAAAAAVLVGAFIVGDSVRGSLRDLTLDRLGGVDYVLQPPRFFAADARRLDAAPLSPGGFAKLVPRQAGVILLDGAVETTGESTSVAGGVSVVGCDDRFFAFYDAETKQAPASGEVFLNAAAAEELGAAAGDEILLRVPTPGEAPADSLLGRKTETVAARRLTIAKVLPNAGPGRFGLNPAQQSPLLAFVAVSELQDLLDRPGEVNTVLFGRATDSARPEASWEDDFPAWQATWEDLGLIAQTSAGDDRPARTTVTSEEMLLPEAVISALAEAFPGDQRQEVQAYLVDSLEGNEQSLNYCIVAGVDPRGEPPLGPMRNVDGDAIATIGDDEIVLSAWAAHRLGLQVGDEATLRYFEPESTHGAVELVDPPTVLRVVAITPVAEATATTANAAFDRDYVPEVPGVTDQDSLRDWDPPFPFELSRVTEDDEEYWDEFRTTPKAFVSLATARRLWDSRFGDTTAVRIAADEATVRRAARWDSAKLGFSLRPVKRQGLAAATGTTPFEGLFIGFSLYILVSALALVLLLFRLGVEQRSAELGLELAVGTRVGRAMRWMATEGLVVAAVGSAIGVALGVAYAEVMIYGLTHWWVAAVGTPFLTTHVTPTALVLGAASALVAAALVIVWSIRGLARLPVRQLLSGETERPWTPRRGRFSAIAAVVLAAGGLGASAAGVSATGMTQVGLFFAAGASVLAAGVAGLSWILRRGGRRYALHLSHPTRWLAMQGARRNARRSVLTTGLMASATFLIGAMSAFRVAPSEQGAGGAALYAESAAPILADLTSEDGRYDAGVLGQADRLLADSRVTAFRLRPGDDASCLNLFQSSRPKVLAVPTSLTDAAEPAAEFAWAQSAATTEAERGNPWSLLDKPLAGGAIPVAVDFDTATYSLKKGLGDEILLPDGRGGELRLQVVGLLDKSIFQGALLISDAAFRQAFPEISGFRIFLIDPGEAADATSAASTLEQGLSQYGFDSTPSARKLAGFLAVQNTYLQTFQSLGGLGLLLGAIGLAAAQLRGVVERRRELALMRAIGFSGSALGKMVFAENALLLAAGLGLGGLAAAVALAPQLLRGTGETPIGLLAAVCLGVVALGLAAGAWAVRAAVRAPVIVSLRGE